MGGFATHQLRNTAIQCVCNIYKYIYFCIHRQRETVNHRVQYVVICYESYLLHTLYCMYIVMQAYLLQSQITHEVNGLGLEPTMSPSAVEGQG